MPVTQIFEQKIFRCYFSVPLVVVHHLGKQIVRQAVEVDAPGRGRPPHMKMGYQGFLSVGVGVCCGCGFDPMFMPGHVDYSLNDSAVVPLENLEL